MLTLTDDQLKQLANARGRYEVLVNDNTSYADAAPKALGEYTDLCNELGVDMSIADMIAWYVMVHWDYMFDENHNRK